MDHRIGYKGFAGFFRHEALIRLVPVPRFHLKSDCLLRSGEGLGLFSLDVERFDRRIIGTGRRSEIGGRASPTARHEERKQEEQVKASITF